MSFSKKKADVFKFFSPIFSKKFPDFHHFLPNTPSPIVVVLCLCLVLLFKKYWKILHLFIKYSQYLFTQRPPYQHPVHTALRTSCIGYCLAHSEPPACYSRNHWFVPMLRCYWTDLWTFGGNPRYRCKSSAKPLKGRGVAHLLFPPICTWLSLSPSCPQILWIRLGRKWEGEHFCLIVARGILDDCWIFSWALFDTITSERNCSDCRFDGLGDMVTSFCWKMRELKKKNITRSLWESCRKLTESLATSSTSLWKVVKCLTIIGKRST